MSLKDKKYVMEAPDPLKQFAHGSEEVVPWEDVENHVKELKEKLGCDNPKEDDAHGNIVEGIIDEVFG